MEDFLQDDQNIARNPSMPDVPQPSPKVKLRWYQYRLRTLHIFMFLVAVACSWLAVKMERARKQKVAANALMVQYAIDLAYDYEVNNTAISGPKWLRKILGDDFFNSISEVRVFGCSGTPLIDSDIRYIEDLRDLRVLAIESRVKISPEGLRFLDRLQKLERLTLDANCFNDESLKYVAQLNQLKSLTLARTQITERGLALLANLKQLHELTIRGTEITDAQLMQINELRQLRKLSLEYCNIANANFTCIKDLRQLRSLSLYGSPLTDNHLNQIKKNAATGRTFALRKILGRARLPIVAKYDANRECYYSQNQLL